jgi:hypothetical protein
MTYQLLNYLPIIARLFRFSLCLMFVGIKKEGGEMKRKANLMLELLMQHMEHVEKRVNAYMYALG